MTDGEMKVFIVEDSPEVLERLVDLVCEVPGVEMAGTAGNFADAITGIISNRPDVGIFDIKLGDDRRGGIDVLSYVKAQMPGLKAIMLSNYVTPQHIRASAEAGAQYFLDKSKDFERIGAVLRKMQNETGVA
jgi:DNA-binding NarL/FixJ family response regulator